MQAFLKQGSHLLWVLSSGTFPLSLAPSQIPAAPVQDDLGGFPRSEPAAGRVATATAPTCPACGRQAQPGPC